MAIYKVQGPDNHVYEFEGPNDASEAEQIAYADHLDQQRQAQIKEHEAKTGFVQSVKSGWHGALGSTEDWLGRTTGSEGLKQAGQANLQKSATEHEATTPEDVARAQGILPTAGKVFSKYVGEPVGGAIGSFGAPIAAGIATSFAAPEIAILGGLMDTASIAAATTAYPMIAGQMMERQEQQSPGEPANEVKANLMAVPASLLFAFKKIPGVDQIAQKLAPSIEAQVATLTPKILGGDITLEAAKKELTSKTGLALKEFGLTTAHASAIMGGSEELIRAQAGQESMTPEEWMDTVGTGALFGALHAPFRGEAGKVAAGEKKLTAADTHIKNEFAKMRDLAAQRELTKEENAKLAELDAEAKKVAEKEAYYKQLTQQDVLPLSSSIEQAKEVQTAASPQGDLFAGAAPTTEAPKAEVVTRKMLNEIGVGPTAKVHKAILGLDINDPKQNEIIQNKLEAHFEKYGPKEGNADKVDAFMNNLKKIGGQDVTKSRLDTESNRAGVQGVDQQELGSTRGIAKSNIGAMDNDRDLFGQYTEGAGPQRNTLEETKPIESSSTLEKIKPPKIEGLHNILGQIKQMMPRYNELEAKVVNKAKPRRDAVDEYQKLGKGIDELYSWLRHYSGDSFWEPRTELGKLLHDLNYGEPKNNLKPYSAEKIAEVEKYIKGLETKAEPSIVETKPVEPVVEEAMPLQDEARKVASQLKAFDPEHPKIEVLKDVDVTPQDLNEAKAELASLKETRAAKGKTSLAEERDVASADVSAMGLPKSDYVTPEVEATVEPLVKKLAAWYDKPAANRINPAAGKYHEMMKGPFDESDLYGAQKGAFSRMHNMIADTIQKSFTDPNVRREAIMHTFQEAYSRAKKIPYERERAEKAPGQSQEVLDTQGAKTYGKALEILKDVNADKLTQSEKYVIDRLLAIPSVREVEYSIKDRIYHDGKEVSGLHTSIGKGRIQIAYDNANGVTTVIHEGVHAATLYSMADHIKGDRRGDISELVAKTTQGQTLIDAYKAAKAAAKSPNDFGVNERTYAFKNLDEFIAEGFANRKFQKFLANLPSLKGKEELAMRDLKPSIWSNFVNAVKQMLGMDKISNSLFADFVEASEPLFKGKVDRLNRNNVPKFSLQERETKFRADGTAIKYVPEHKKGFIESVKEPFHGGAPLWRSLSDKLANKVVSKYSSVKNKLFDANIPAVSSKQDGQMRADLIALNSDLAVGTTQAALLQGKLVIEKSGMPMAQKGEVNITDVSKGFKDLLDKATSELGDADLAYDMVSAGWVGPRYEQLKAKNEAIEARIEKLKEAKKGNWAAKVRAAEKEKAYVEDWDASDQATYEEAKRRFGPELDKLRDMRNKMREPLIKALVDSHRLDAETAKEWIDNIDYVPFYRVPAEEMMDKQGRPITVGSGLLNVGRNYKLKGSKRAVADPMDNFINNMEYWTQAAIKNNAAVRLADTLVNLGAAKYAERKLTAGESKNNYWVPIYKDGVEKQLILADPNDMAAFSAAPILQGLVWDIARKGTSLLRHGITMMPQFVYNQALEDPVRATLVSGNKAGFLNNLAGTWKSVWKNQITSQHTEGADVLNRAGLIGQKDFLNPQDIKNRYLGTDKKGFNNGLLFFERLAQGSDLGARETIYNNAMKELKAEGYDETTARALAITRATEYMPHQQIGTSRSLAYLRAMMPFVNAPIQGLARDVAAARGRLSGVDKAQGQKMLMWRIGKYAAFTAIYSAFNSGDPEYESQTEDQKDNYFFIGGAKIPAPQEIRPLKALIERGTRAWILNAPEANIENSDVAAAVIKKSWEIISGLAVPIPAAIRPGFENVINYDIFSKHPIVGAGKIHDAPFMQYTDSTSELAKAVGAALNVSPLKVDHLLSGYFGYIGQTVEKFSNTLVEGRPTQNLNEWMFVGSMVQNPYGSGPKTEAYDLLDKATEVKATIKDLQAAGKIDKLKDYIKENKGYVAAAPAINDLHTKITNMRRLRTQISQSNMSDDEKQAKINLIKQNEIQALSQVHELHRKIIALNDKEL
jgi:hypothetical protein